MLIKKLEKIKNTPKRRSKRSNLNSEKLKIKYQVLSEVSKVIKMMVQVLMTTKMTTMKAESRVNFNLKISMKMKMMMMKKRKEKKLQSIKENLRELVCLDLMNQVSKRKIQATKQALQLLLLDLCLHHKINRLTKLIQHIMRKLM